jgi:hypothetical protein
MEADRSTQLPPLPCPECREAGRGGGARIGNKRRHCRTCNTWAANVSRLLAKRLKEKFPDEAAALRLQIEADMYPQVIEDYLRQGPS